MYLGGDVLAITLAHMLAFRLVEHFLLVPMNALNPFRYHRFYIPFFVVILYLFEGYKSPEMRRPEHELERSCKAVAVSFLGLVLFNFLVFRSETFSRYLLISWFVLACILLVATRFTFHGIYRKLWKAGFCRRRAVLVGSTAALSQYQQLLAIQRHQGHEMIGVLVESVTAASESTPTPELPVLGTVAQWEKALLDTRADVLMVAYPVASDIQCWLSEVLIRCKQIRVDVEFYPWTPAMVNMDYERDEFSGCFRFHAKPEWSLALQRLLKRAVDVAIGLIGRVVTILLTPIVFILVNMDGRGPLFYRSAYLGQDGNTHYYLKFRTMRVDADRILETDSALRERFSGQQKLVDDPRITKVGRLLRKSSLDEFPQFFSVLIGKLTLVGPRTIRKEEAARYGPQLEKLLSIKPGVTGFWQVMGRQTTTYQERVCMDMFYIDRWSIWLDLVIIAKTFWRVLTTEGAY